MRIILASSSSRRKELLKYIVDDFEVIFKNIDETLNFNYDIDKTLEDLAFKKADIVFKENQDAVVIGCDTVLVFEGEILGKPKNIQDAVDTLNKLSGKVHSVKTSVAIVSKNKQITFTSTCKVEFESINLKEILDYVNNNEVLDKAGSYAIQGKAAKFIKKIDGDYYSVVGLPINLLYKHLKEF